MLLCWGAGAPGCWWPQDNGVAECGWPLGLWAGGPGPWPLPRTQGTGPGNRASVVGPGCFTCRMILCGTWTGVKNNTKNENAP